MTHALRIAGLAVLGALMALVLRRADRHMGAAAVISAGLLLLLLALDPLLEAVQALRQLSQQAGLTQESTQRLGKMLGMTLITEFAAQLCRDAGEEGLCQKCSFAGKCLLLSMTIPMLLELGQTIQALMPG